MMLPTPFPYNRQASVLARLGSLRKTVAEIERVSPLDWFTVS